MQQDNSHRVLELETNSSSDVLSRKKLSTPTNGGNLGEVLAGGGQGRFLRSNVSWQKWSYGHLGLTVSSNGAGEFTLLFWKDMMKPCAVCLMLLKAKKSKMWSS